MKLVCVIFNVLSSGGCVSSSFHVKMLQRKLLYTTWYVQSMIELINQKNAGWTAGYNDRFLNATLADAGELNAALQSQFCVH